jgi:hypothetical protein
VKFFIQFLLEIVSSPWNWKHGMKINNIEGCCRMSMYGAGIIYFIARFRSIF